MLYVADHVVESMFEDTAGEIYRRRVTAQEAAEILAREEHKVMEFPTAKYPMLPKVIKMQELGIPISGEVTQGRFTLRAGDAVLYIRFIAKANGQDKLMFALWEVC